MSLVSFLNDLTDIEGLLDVIIFFLGWESLLVRAPDWKVASSNPGWSGGRIFFSRLTVCALIRCLFHPRVTAVGHKIPRSFLPKAQVAGYTWTHKHPWPNEAGVGWLCRCPGIVWEPYQATSSHATRQGTLSHSHFSSLSHCGLILV